MGSEVGNIISALFTGRRIISGQPVDDGCSREAGQ